MIEWITEHGLEIWTIVASLVTIATIVARLTPTQKDDVFVEKYIRKPFEKISQLFLPDRK